MVVERTPQPPMQDFNPKMLKIEHIYERTRSNKYCQIKLFANYFDKICCHTTNKTLPLCSYVETSRSK